MQSTKSKILDCLQGEAYVSGNALAEQLNVSRTAIWKNIQALKNEGYQIEAVQNKGYTLVEASQNINQAKLLSIIEKSTLFDQLIYKKTVDSTQNTAFNILHKNDDNIVIVSEAQTEGRGRFKRQWLSPKETGLYMSLVLRPNIKHSDMITFNLFMSLAISQTIRQNTGLESGIKWPNDIYISDKKVCGFLTEIVSEEDTVQTIICGVGINIEPSTDIESLSTATAINSELPAEKQLDIDSFLSELFKNIEIYYNKFMSTNFSEIRDEWVEHSIIFNRQLKITSSNGMINGKALDVNDEGYLIIIDEEQNIHQVISADIEI